MIVTKPCQVCGVEFAKPPSCSVKRWESVRRFCSLRCKGIESRGRTAWTKGKVTKTCEVCSVEYIVYPYRADTARFCSRKCHGSTRVGMNGINWQGGKTPLHKAIRNSNQYKEWRSAVFERDGYRCVVCAAGGWLEADHIRLFSQFPELRFDLANGQTLCKPCHKAKTARDLNWSVGLLSFASDGN